MVGRAGLRACMSLPVCAAPGPVILSSVWRRLSAAIAALHVFWLLQPPVHTQPLCWAIHCQCVRAGTRTSSSTCAGRDAVAVSLLSPMWVVSLSLHAAAILPLSHFGSTAVVTPNDIEFCCSVSQIPALLFWAGLEQGGALKRYTQDMTLPSTALSRHSLGTRLHLVSSSSKMDLKATHSGGICPRAAWSLFLTLGCFSWNTLGDTFPLLWRVGFLFGFEHGQRPGEHQEHLCRAPVLGREVLSEPLSGIHVSYDFVLLTPCLSHTWVLCWIK